MWTGLGFGVVMLMSVSVCALHPVASDASAKPSPHALGAYNPTAFAGLPALGAASSGSSPAAVAEQRQRTPTSALRMSDQQNLEETQHNYMSKSLRREFLGNAMSAAAGVAALTAASPANARDALAYPWNNLGTAVKKGREANGNGDLWGDNPMEKAYRGLSKNGVSFISPKDNAKVKGKFTAEFGLTGYQLSPAKDGIKAKTGHHHLIIDMDKKFVAKGETIPMDATHIHYGKAQTTGDLNLEPGEHTLTLQFADANHVSYGEEFAKTIKVTVEGAKKA